MPPITWQNVNAPSRSRSASDFGSVNNMITGGFDAIGDALITRQADLRNQYDTKVDKNTDNYLDAVANINTLDALNSDQTAAQLAALRNAGPIDQDAIRGAVDTQRTSLMDRTNTRNTFDLGQAKLAAKPLVSQFNQAIANLDGDAAAKILTENPEALRSADALADMQKQLSDFTLDQRGLRAGQVVDTITGLLATDNPKDIARANELRSTNQNLLTLEGLYGRTGQDIFDRQRTVDTDKVTTIEDEIETELALGTEEGIARATNILTANEDLMNKYDRAGVAQKNITDAQDLRIANQRGNRAEVVAAEGQIKVTRFKNELAALEEEYKFDRNLTILGDDPTPTFADINAIAHEGSWDTAPGDLQDEEGHLFGLSIFPSAGKGLISDRKSDDVYKEILKEETNDSGLSRPVQMKLLALAVGDLGDADTTWYKGGENDIDDVKERLAGNYRAVVIDYLEQQKAKPIVDKAKLNLEQQEGISKLQDVIAGFTGRDVKGEAYDESIAAIKALQSAMKRRNPNYKPSSYSVN